MRRWFFILSWSCWLLGALSDIHAQAAATNEIRVAGTKFMRNGEEFPYTGLSFFNALYNADFNQSSGERRRWLRKFRQYGVNVLRVWAQWDSKRGYVDTRETATLYHPDGSLRTENLWRLREVLDDAAKEDMVIELVLFAQESWHDGIRLSPESSERAVAAVTEALLPWRGVTFQIWNEFSERVLEHVRTIRRRDPKRLVTNSPGGAGVLGDPAQNESLDYLTPHTSRQSAGKPWELGPRELASLLQRYRKPVVDDEPARTGTRRFGGPGGETFPQDHILQIYQVWKAGGYITYHHDMFQTPGTSAVPAHGIPDPEFSPYHRQVFEFISRRERYREPQPSPPSTPKL